MKRLGVWLVEAIDVFLAAGLCLLVLPFLYLGRWIEEQSTGSRRKGPR